MRDIKFRAFDAHSGEMYYSTERIGYDELYFDFTKDGLRLMRHMDEDYPEITEAKVMQFTGLKDKFGVEIYEGDILKLSQPIDGNFIDTVYKWYYVKYENAGFSYIPMKLGNVQYTISPFSDENLEVIGNIHQNPELL